jgi:hypothetical protein
MQICNIAFFMFVNNKRSCDIRACIKYDLLLLNGQRYNRRGCSVAKSHEESLIIILRNPQGALGSWERELCLMSESSAFLARAALGYGVIARSLEFCNGNGREARRSELNGVHCQAAFRSNISSNLYLDDVMLSVRRDIEFSWDFNLFYCTYNLLSL